MECDSVKTAETLYNECDGIEFESTANKLDLRFIPDEVSFDDDDSRDECTHMPPKSYKAPNFFTQALQSTNVALTWDRDDPKRTKLLSKKFTNDEEVYNRIFFALFVLLPSLSLLIVFNSRRCDLCCAS